MEQAHFPNKTYVIGRRGQLRVNGSTVSSKHAELSILNDRLYLTDLESSNGTFVMRNGKKHEFREGYVEPNEPIFLGSQQVVLAELLEIA